MGLSWTDRVEDVSAHEWDSVLVRSFRPSPFPPPPLPGPVGEDVRRRPPQAHLPLGTKRRDLRAVVSLPVRKRERMGASRRGAGLRLAGRRGRFRQGDGVLVRVPLLLAGFPLLRSPPPPAPRGRVPFDRLPPPAVRRTRPFLPSGGDGPGPVWPPSPLLRRVPP